MTRISLNPFDSAKPAGSDRRIRLGFSFTAPEDVLITVARQFNRTRACPWLGSSTLGVQHRQFFAIFVRDDPRHSSEWFKTVILWLNEKCAHALDHLMLECALFVEEHVQRSAAAGRRRNERNNPKNNH
jgi:hypothetical protein